LVGGDWLLRGSGLYLYDVAVGLLCEYKFKRVHAMS